LRPPFPFPPASLLLADRRRQSPQVFFVRPSQNFVSPGKPFAMGVGADSAHSAVRDGDGKQPIDESEQSRGSERARFSKAK